MTENQYGAVTTTPRPSLPVGQAMGQAVGQAEAALSGMLIEVLTRTGITRETYLALQRIVALGGSAGREDYAADLSDSLGLDLWAAGQRVSTLVSAGLLAEDEAGGETIRLTAAGTELRGRLQDAVRAVTAPLWESLDPAALNTTIRTLEEITARARALRPAGGFGANGEGA
jgi:hypothetical protein